MAREYVPIFFEWLDVTQDLTQEQKGNLIDAAVLYASGGNYQAVLTGVEIIAFRFIKGQIDRNAAISDARSKAGSNKNEQNGTNENKTEQKETKLLKEKEKEKEKDKEKQNDNYGFMSEDDAKEIQLEQDRVLNAAEDAGFQRNNSVRAGLIRLYSEHGLNKLLDGISECVRHGVSNLAYLEAVLKGNPKKAQSQYNPNSAHNFTERDYSGVQKEIEDKQNNHIVEMLCKNNGLWDEEKNCPVDGWREKLDKMKETKGA